MTSQFDSVKLKTLRERLATLFRQYEVVSGQINTTLSDAEKVTLQLKLDTIEEDIKDVEKQANEITKTSATLVEMGPSEQQVQATKDKTQLDTEIADLRQKITILEEKIQLKSKDKGWWQGLSSKGKVAVVFITILLLAIIVRWVSFETANLSERPTEIAENVAVITPNFTPGSVEEIDNQPIEVVAVSDPTATETPSPSATATNTPTATPTETRTPTATETSTPTATETSTSTPTSTSTMTPIPCRLLDTFDSGMQMNWWTPDSDVFAYFTSSNQTRQGSQSLQINYTKDDTYQFMGAEVPVGQRDFSWARTVNIYVYGQVPILLKLEDESLVQRDVVTMQATNPSGWTLLSFDITGLRSYLDLRHIKSLFFFPAPGDSSASGTIFFDTISICP